ncbi:MAG: hypothetical protein H7296_04585 [Bacteroidia bacterium]|nr:hypothetical protein [Bacteroidia bacterium]
MNGQIIMAIRVISNANPSKTYLNLVGSENISKKLIDKLAKTCYSVASLILLMTVDLDVKAAGMDSGNI